MNDHTLIIRPAIPSDADFITTCTTAAYRIYVQDIGRMPEPMTVDYVASLPKYDSWIAEKDSHSLGFLLMQYEASSALIFSIAVLPNTQGQSVGTNLLLHAESRAKEKGYKTICLYTNEKMIRNLEFYRKKGYAETSRESRGKTAIVHMEKSI